VVDPKEAASDAAKQAAGPPVSTKVIAAQPVTDGYGVIEPFVGDDDDEPDELIEEGPADKIVEQPAAQLVEEGPADQLIEEGPADQLIEEGPAEVDAESALAAALAAARAKAGLPAEPAPEAPAAAAADSAADAIADSAADSAVDADAAADSAADADAAADSAADGVADPPADAPPADAPDSDVASTRDDDDSSEDDLPPPAPEPQEKEPVDETEAKVLEQEKANEREWRKIYETVYHKMERDARIHAAKTVEGSHLMALCFDPEPQVVFALMSNPRFGLEEARFLAFHHKTATGLEMIARNSELLKDNLVQRRLLRNQQLPTMILRKIINPKLLMDTYKVAIDREVPERTRVQTCDLLRRKFSIASGDERAALVIKTEARCLILLTNCAFDANTTNILCGRTSWTVLCIQNLARWSATPPQLLRVLLKLPHVKQNVGLRKMLLKHPNMPSDVKRAFMIGKE
jgi:hypothetical protein